MSSTKSVKPCFPHPGGKTKLLPHILPLIPAHRTYMEPFCGGLAVFLAKERAKVEVINDADKQLANFYRYVRNHKEALFVELEKQLCSREDFAIMKANPGKTDLERAVHWFLLRVNSFGGMSGTFGRGRDHFHGFDRNRHFRLIEELSERLTRVCIESKDWEEVVEFYDARDAFFFFDPPYVNCGKTAYEAFTEIDMQRVRSRLDKLKGTWLLTCDDSPQCRRIFKGLPLRQLSVKYSTDNKLKSKQKTRKDFHELLVMSPRLETELKAA